MQWLWLPLIEMVIHELLPLMEMVIHEWPLNAMSAKWTIQKSMSAKWTIKKCTEDPMITTTSHIKAHTWTTTSHWNGHTWMTYLMQLNLKKMISTIPLIPIF